MANTITGRKPDFSRRRKTARLTVALTGNYVQVGATTGEVLDLSNILNPMSQPNTMFGGIPNIDDFAVTKGPAGHICEVVALTPTTPTLANSFALKVYASAETELAAAAYSAAILAAVVYLEVNTSTWGQD